MKLEKWISVFAAAILAFGAAVGGLGCMVTGLELEKADMALVTAVCAAAAAIFALCLRFRLGLPAFGMGVLTVLWMWLKGPLNGSAELLLMQISKVYNGAYGTAVVRWSSENLQDTELTAALCVLGCTIALTVAFAVIRRRWLGPGILLTVLPLAACLVTTDTVPAVGYLFLTVLVLVLLLLTWQVRQQSERRGNVLLGLLCFPVVLAVGLLFVMNPQEDYAHQDGAEKLEQAVLELLGQADTVLPEPSVSPRPSKTPESSTVSTTVSPAGVAVRKVDLARVGPRQPLTSVSLTVGAQQTGTVYLRGCAYTLYDGLQWQTFDSQSLEDARFAAAEDGDVLTLSIQTTGLHSVRYTTYSPAEALIFTQGRLENDGSLREYQVEYIPPQTYQAAWDTIAADTAFVPEEYFSLPGEMVAAAQAYLTRMLGEVPGCTTAGQAWKSASAIIELVKNSAVYSLQTPAMPADAEDFALWFLENSDTGYCVHFATAATVLLRAAGLPARYVTGYLVEARAGETVQVPESSAHAWVECYIGGVGWVALEPTPAAQTTVPIQPQQPSGPEQTEPAPSQQETQIKPAPTEGTKQPPIRQETPAVQLDWRWLLLPAAVLAVLGQWQLRLWLRQKRRQHLRANALALALWQETSRLSRLLDCAPNRELYTLAQKARFSQHTIQSEELDQFYGAIAAQKEQLRKKHAGWQLLYCLVLAVY